MSVENKAITLQQAKTLYDDLRERQENIPSAENIVMVQDQQPTVPANKVWLTETPPAGVDVPTYQEFTGVIAPDYADLDFPVSAGEHCIHNGVLYTAVQNINASEAWTAAHWEAGSVSSKLTEISTAIDGISGGGKLLDVDVKTALINLFDHVAYTDGNAQVYIKALKDAWDITATVESISADFEQGSAVIDVNADLNTLRQYLTVTGTFIYEGSTFEEEVIDYTLSGTLESGENTITVTYKDKTTTFTVYIESLIPAEYQQVEYVGATAQDQYILFDDIQTATDVEAAKYAFEIEFQFDEWNSAANTNIIAGFSSAASLWIGYNNQVENIAMGTASGCYFTDNNPTAKHKYSYEFATISGSYGKGKFTRDDNAVIERQANSQNFSNSIFCLFSGVDSTSGSGRNSNFDFKGKIYSFSMTYEGDPLLNLIPCYRKSDNVIGFYDTVEGTFYTNSGSGTFTKGGNV